MDKADELAKLFVSFSRDKLIGEIWPKLSSCLDELSDEQIWWRPNAASNSIGNLLLHLNGNVRQWIVQAIGGEENNRDRDAEFREQGPVRLSELRGRLEATLQETDAVLSKLTADDLLRKHHIQVYPDVPGMSAIYHVVEHFSMHYGQILYISKLLNGKDLGFYAYLSRR